MWISLLLADDAVNLRWVECSEWLPVLRWEAQKSIRYNLCYIVTITMGCLDKQNSRLAAKFLFVLSLILR